jgi:hypothetical protein
MENAASVAVDAPSAAAPASPAETPKLNSEL